MTGKPRSRDQIGPPSQTDEVEEKLLSAAITADVILEPGLTDPRPIRGYSGQPEPVEPIPALVPVTPDERPRAPGRRPFGQGDGLRLMPLAGFIWGGQVHARSGPGPAIAAPRLRGDHVILFIARGGAHIQFPRKRQFLGQGRIAFVPAGTAFSFEAPAGTEGLALLVPPTMLGQLPIPLPSGFRNGIPHPTDAALIEPALRALGQGGVLGQRDTDATNCHLGLLSLALSRAVDRPQIHDPDQLHVLSARPLAENFLALAGRHLADGRTISDMARELGCTLAQLDNACIEIRGKHALDLIYGLRLERAAALLRDSDMPIATIAQELGYSGIGHFMRVFAAATGRTPEAFRHSARQEPGQGE